jgi:hypothetical protein
MPDLIFAQAERRSYLAPILVAVVILAAGIGFYLWHLPFRIANVTVTHTNVLPTHTVFASDSRVVGIGEQAEDAFFVLAAVRVDNRMKDPLYINDITGTLTSSDDSQLQASAIGENDISNLFITFPKLKPLASPPLLRESTIPPGGSAEGMVLLSFPVSEDVWNKRKSASVTVNFYHQGSFTAPIPNSK